MQLRLQFGDDDVAVTTERGESNAAKSDRPSSDITTAAAATTATGLQGTTDEVLKVYPLAPVDNDEEDAIFVSDAVRKMLLYPVAYKVIQAPEEAGSTSTTTKTACPIISAMEATGPTTATKATIGTTATKAVGPTNATEAVIPSAVTEVTCPTRRRRRALNNPTLFNRSFEPVQRLRANQKAFEPDEPGGLRGDATPR